jgi:hypothetical protein
MEVRRAAMVVVQRAVGVHGHAVDGEVAAGRVLVPVGGPGHFGVAAVGADVAPERGDLDRRAVEDGGDGAVRQAGLEDAEAGALEALRDLLRRERRGHVEVLHRQAGQRVAHAAADGAGAGQRVEHRLRGWGAEDIRQAHRRTCPFSSCAGT